MQTLAKPALDRTQVKERLEALAYVSNVLVDMKEKSNRLYRRGLDLALEVVQGYRAELDQLVKHHQPAQAQKEKA